MARLVNLQLQAEERSAVAQAEAQLLRAREAERVEALEGERAALGARVAELEAALLEQRILVTRIVSSRRHRIGAVLAAPIDLVRRRRRR
jgi:hypothetical protein